MCNLENLIIRAGGLLRIVGHELAQSAMDYKFPADEQEKADALCFVAQDSAYALSKQKEIMWERLTALKRYCGERTAAAGN